MPDLDLAYATDPAHFGPTVEQTLADIPQHTHPPGPIETVRRDRYRGHEITVRTTYLIEIDGRPLGGHVGVSRSGNVHTHALPNYSFTSALDMARQLIDSFPAVYGPDEDLPDPDNRHDHGEGN